jgi:hypothetical protein
MSLGILCQAGIRKALDSPDEAGFAIEIGLIDRSDWPARNLFCTRDKFHYYGPRLGLTADQTEAIEQVVRQDLDREDQRDAALAVLNDAQRAKLASFQAALQVARSLGWRAREPAGEPLCH